MKITEIIEKIKQLDLSSYPANEIKELLTKIFQLGVPIVVTDYRKPKEIERAVNNTEKEPEFSSKNRISYKPAHLNNTYQRASTPENTMFYASVIPEGELSKNEIKYARIIGASEVVDLMRDDLDGERTVTFGKWEIQELISVATIIDPNKDYNVGYINKLKEDYLKQDLPVEFKKERDEILTFFSNEFAKEVQQGENHEYLVSAILSELIVNNGYDGILYPSVQSFGYGLCLALHPRVMEKLKLKKVMQCKVEKNGMEVNIPNEKICIIKDDSDKFKLEDIT